MKILMFNEHSGTQSSVVARRPDLKVTTKTTLKSFVTNLNLIDALACLKDYEKAYKEKYPLYFEYELLMVGNLEEGLDLREVGLEVIEDLPQT